MRVHSYTCAYVYTRERNYNFLFPISDSSDKKKKINNRMLLSALLQSTKTDLRENMM